MSFVCVTTSNKHWSSGISLVCHPYLYHTAIPVQVKYFTPSDGALVEFQYKYIEQWNQDNQKGQYYHLQYFRYMLVKIDKTILQQAIW